MPDSPQMKARIPVKMDPIATMPIVSPVVRPLARLLEPVQSLRQKLKSTVALLSLPSEYDDAFTAAATLTIS